MANDKLTEMFSEYLTIYKLVNRKTIISCLQTELKNQTALKVYALTNGENSTRDIATLIGTGCSHGTVALLWKKWALAGITIQTEKKGRFKAAFDLEEYGITDVQEEQ